MVVSIVHLEGILKFCIEENQLEVTHMDPVFLEKKKSKRSVVWSVYCSTLLMHVGCG